MAEHGVPDHRFNKQHLHKRNHTAPERAVVPDPRFNRMRARGYLPFVPATQKEEPTKNTPPIFPTPPVPPPPRPPHLNGTGDTDGL